MDQEEEEEEERVGPGRASSGGRVRGKSKDTKSGAETECSQSE